MPNISNKQSNKERHTSNFSNAVRIVSGNMSKSVSKSEAVKVINATDALEVLLQTIDRNETTSTKQTKVNRFIDDIKKQVKAERDVILIAVKVK